MVGRQLNLMTTADPLVIAYMAAARVHYPDDTRRLLLRTFVARILLQQQKSVRNHAKMQLQQNAQQTWLPSSDTDDDVILIAGVLLSGAFVNECKKKVISAKEAVGLVDG